MSFSNQGSQPIHYVARDGSMRRSSVSHGSPMRAAMELRSLREAMCNNTVDQLSSTSFPVLSSYEQVVGCILESLKSSTISIEDFDRGIEAVRSHVKSTRRFSSYDTTKMTESCSIPGMNVTPVQKRDRACSLNLKPVPLSWDEDEMFVRCERKWSMDTASTTLPPSCTNERRLRVLTSVPCSSPTVGCSPAPNIPLPPPSPNTFACSRPRAFSQSNIDPVTPSLSMSPFITPIMTSALAGCQQLIPISPLSFADITIGDTVGAGSFGIVHRARVNKTGELIAVKVVAVDSRDKSAVAHIESLENELFLLQSLQHPRIVRYLGHERISTESEVSLATSPLDDSDKLVVMCEYMSGGSVASAIRQFGPFDEKAIALHTKHILEGLAFLHEHRVCHRDLKCDNILIDVSGSCKLADFGCSKLLDVSPEGSTVIMKSLKGSIPWMAPEVLMGEGYGKSSDIWAVGCLVLEMALGRNPWGHFDNIMQAMYRIGMGTKGPEIPETMGDLYTSMFICADIGGTSARLQVFSEIGLHTRSNPLYGKTYSTGSVVSFVDLFAGFVSEAGCGSHFKTIVCGIPGDVIDNRVEPMNIPHWGIVDGNELMKCGLADKCIILNDFECAGFALNALSSSDLCILRSGRTRVGNVKVMVGVGTGLGVTFATQTDGVYVPYSSEAGWTTFSPIAEIDYKLVDFIKARNGWKSLGFEQVCSGRAVGIIHEFFTHQAGLDYSTKTPSDICKEFYSCSISRLTIQLLLEYLGRFLSQLGIIFKPSEGIFLCGGLMDSLNDIIKNDDSFFRGLDSQPAPILSDIAGVAPIYYVDIPDVGLCGARECCIIIETNSKLP